MALGDGAGDKVYPTMMIQWWGLKNGSFNAVHSVCKTGRGGGSDPKEHCTENIWRELSVHVYFFQRYHLDSVLQRMSHFIQIVLPTSFARLSWVKYCMICHLGTFHWRGTCPPPQTFPQAMTLGVGRVPENVHHGYRSDKGYGQNL